MSEKIQSQNPTRTVRKVNVSIAEQSITLFTDQDQERVNKTVDLVDRTCQDIMVATKMPLTHRSALLAAIKLAERVVELEAQLTELRTQVDTVTKQAIDAVDSVLNPKNS